MLALSTNLANYDHKRMVVMGPSTTVYDAARALEANHIGSVVVTEGDRVLGIVTDRDLALRVIGYDLDAHDLSLRDVMTRDVATIPVTATEKDAAELMLARHVRRIPIEDHGRIVGIVTLDDLVIHGFDATTVARIIAAQLAEPARLKEKGDVHPMAPTHERADAPSAAERAERRHQAHAQSSYDALLRRVMTETGLDTRERAAAALDAVLSGIVERITPEEAAELLAQLPSTLREQLRAVPSGPDRSVTRESIERVLSVRLGIGEARASQLLVRLGRALAVVISRGELRDVMAQLPDDLRSIFA
jgi:CBS domain-containing protein/uncharacterized protein (DUF2267 family)